MERRKRRRPARIAWVCYILLSVIVLQCLAEVRIPMSGEKQKKSGGFVIDISNVGEGYVMVKAKEGKKRYKVRVKKDKTTLNYDLNNSGEYEVFPLQLGDGKYIFTLYRNISGNKYSEEGKITVDFKANEENVCFLYPNQYVNYTSDSPVVAEAEKLLGSLGSAREKFDAVCEYMKTHFSYDYIKAVTVKAGTMPDIDGSWKKHMGICQDLSAIMCCMLRSQGVPCKIMIGTLGSGTAHAWVTAIIDGEDVFFDPTAALNGVNKNETYTLERYY